MSEFIRYSKMDPSDSEKEQRYSMGSQEQTGEITLGTERIEGMGKDFINITIHWEGHERSAGSYVAKKFYSKEDALNEIEKCHDLSRNGIPVPVTHRYAQVAGEHLIIYTDLSDGGKNQVWSANNHFELGESLELTPKQFEGVVEKVAEISITASMISYNVRHDAYFVVKKPNDEVEVIIGDLGLGVRKNPRGMDLGNENKRAGNNFLNWIQGDQGFDSPVEYI